MAPEDLKKLTQRGPFVPMRFIMSDGRAYVVRHPDFIFVTRSWAVISPNGDEATGVPGALEFLSLNHLVRVEDLVASELEV